MNTHFQLFSNCILVKGALRSSICDIQRNDFFLFPSGLYDVLEKLNKGISIQKLFEEQTKDIQKNISEALSYLEDKEFGFYCTEEDFKLFPKLNTRYETPYKLNNIVLELNSFDQNRIERTKEIIEYSSCLSLNIVCYFSLSLSNIQFINKLFKGSTLSSISIITKYNENYHNEDFLNYLKSSLTRLNQIFFSCAPEDNKINYEKYLVEINFITKEIKNFNFCGQVGIDHFSINKEKVLESLNFNSCLYKKLAIDVDGNIKNCPALSNSYGHIKNINEFLLEKNVFQNSEYKELGFITKDEIEICKDCEFRHICTDCRAFTRNNKKYSKPLKCGYDPFKGIWEESSTSTLKKKENQNIL